MRRTPAWLARVAAERAEQRGWRAYRRGDLTTAWDRLDAALRGWHALHPHSCRVSGVLNALGRVAVDRGDDEFAEQLFRNAIEVETRRAGSPPGTPEAANADNNLGRLLLARGDHDAALEHLTNAHAVLSATGRDPVEAAMVLINIGAVHEARDDLDKAASHTRQALSLVEPVAAAPAEAVITCRTNLAVIELRRGRIETAREGLLTALKETRLARLPGPGASVLLNLGHLETEAGDITQARAYLQAAFVVREAIAPESPGVAAACLGLARAGLAGGDLQEADEHAHRAAGIYAAAGQRAPHGTALAVAAAIRAAAGDFAESLVLYRQALDLHRSVEERSEAVANDLNNIGLVYHDTGDLRRAAGYYRRALDVQEQVAPDSAAAATMRNNLGVALRALGDTDAALVLYQRALDWDRRTVPGSPQVAADLSNLAAVLLDRGDDQQALVLLREAVALDVASAPDSLSTAHSRASLAMALWRTGDLPGALSLARQAVATGRARAPGSDRLVADLTLLGELTAENGDLGGAVAILTEAVAIVESLGSRASDRESSLAGLHGSYRALVRALVLRGRENDLAAAFTWDDRGKARTLRDRLQSAVPAETPLHARHRQLRHRIASAEREAAGAAPALRDEYDRVTEELAVRHPPTVMSPPGTDDLPARAQAVLADGEVLISYAIAGPDVIAWTVTRDALRGHRLPVTADRLAELVEQVTGGYRAGRRQAPPPVAIQELAAILPPALPTGASRLVVVPDGRLAYLPFELLVADRFVVSYVPSATVLIELRRRPPSAAPRAFAGFGAPPAGGHGLRPIQGATIELTTLAGLFPDGETHLGTDATVAAVRRRAPQHRMIHFATHGLLDDVNPLYSALVLAPPPDDGLLQVHAMADLGLDADLVVCSACQTGLGMIRAGEGPIGMARALLSAGARRVVLSLWPVPDLATRRLMRAFYRHLSDGLTPEDALHRARAPMVRDGDPMVWAAFVIVGSGPAASL